MVEKKQSGGPQVGSNGFVDWVAVFWGGMMMYQRTFCFCQEEPAKYGVWLR